MDRRRLLIAVGAGGVAAAAAPVAFAAPESANPLLQGQATRTGPDALRLDWSPKGSPMAIFASNDPDALSTAMRPVIPVARGGDAALPAAISPRPYVLLRTPDGRTLRLAERLLPLQGGRNFRDLGGWRSADGRQVRWGRIYRSGVMTGLTDGDMTYLTGLGIGVICDLRSHQERTSQPNPFLAKSVLEVVGTDYDMISLAPVMQAPNRSEAISAFARSYLQFAQVLTPQYTDMFARLVRRQTPLAFNCSAGKDRSGIAAALILSVLGVPRETVLADYALSQVYVPPALQLQQAARARGEVGSAAAGPSSEQAKAFAKVPPEVMDVILGSDPEVMRQALAMMDHQFGGPVELAKSRYGLDDGKIGVLKATYLI